MEYLGFKYDNKYNLSDRELEVLKLIIEGLDNHKVAEKLFISVHTAKAHVSNILRKMNAVNRTQACHLAIEDRLIKDDKTDSDKGKNDKTRG